MRYLLKLLSVVFGIGSIGLGIWVLICSFSLWIGIWGIAGVFFNLFLMPVAVLGYPLVESIASDNWMFMLGYLDIATVVILMALASWFGKKSEEIGGRAFSQQTYHQPTYQEPFYGPPTQSYIGNRKTGVYHLPRCYYAQLIDPDNEILFNSAVQAIREGFKPCQMCNP